VITKERILEVKATLKGVYDTDKQKEGFGLTADEFHSLLDLAIFGLDKSHKTLNEMRAEEDLPRLPEPLYVYDPNKQKKSITGEDWAIINKMIADAMQKASGEFMGELVLYGDFYRKCGSCKFRDTTVCTHDMVSAKEETEEGVYLEPEDYHEPDLRVGSKFGCTHWEGAEIPFEVYRREK